MIARVCETYVEQLYIWTLCSHQNKILMKMHRISHITSCVLPVQSSEIRNSRTFAHFDFFLEQHDFFWYALFSQMTEWYMILLASRPAPRRARTPYPRGCTGVSATRSTATSTQKARRYRWRRLWPRASIHSTSHNRCCKTFVSLPQNYPLIAERDTF